MQARRFRSIALAAMSVWAFTISTVAPARPGVRQLTTNPLVGVWRFESEIDTAADGTVVARVTSSEKHGFIIYTVDKFVSATIMPSKRRWLLPSATRHELEASADDGTAYAGRYEIDTATQTVTHVLSVSFEPTYERRRLRRSYVLRGRALELSGTYSSQGKDFKFTVRLSRAL